MLRSRRFFWIALALAGLAAGAAAIWVLSRPDVTEGGPLTYVDPEYEDHLEFTVPLDTAYTWGLAILRNSGETDAIVERVSLVDLSDEIRELDVRAIPETAPGGVGFAPGFDADAGQAVEGLVVPPGDGNGFQLVFGLEVGESGMFGFDGVRVEYTVGGKRFETTLPHAVLLCAPVEEFEECPPPDSASTDA